MIMLETMAPTYSVQLAWPAIRPQTIPVYTGGVMRSIEVSGATSCTGLTVVDSLDAFNWVCRGGTNPVRMVSFGFKKGKGLSDLIDFTGSKWKPIHIDVSADGNPFMTSDLTTWWFNPVVVNNDGSNGSDMNTGEIHIITANPQAVYTVGANKVAVVIKPGVTMTGSGAANETLITANSRSFVWIEGSLDATGDDGGISFSTTQFSVLDSVNVSNANLNGIELLSASNSNRLSKITSNLNGAFGIQLIGSSNNELRETTTNNNSNIGVFLLTSSDKNKLSNISANANTNVGINLNASSDNALSDITVSGHDNGGNTGKGLVVTGASSNNNMLINITAHLNDHGIDLVSSTYNTVINIASSTNNFKGINLTASLNNYFTGDVRVGGGQSVNCNDDPPDGDGGLDHTTCANNGASDATLTTSSNLAASFNATDWELLTSDTQIRNILSLPTGNDT